MPEDARDPSVDESMTALASFSGLLIATSSGATHLASLQATCPSLLAVTNQSEVISPFRRAMWCPTEATGDLVGMRYAFPNRRGGTKSQLSNL